MQLLFRKNSAKWLTLFLILLVTAALQTTPFLFPSISGIRPILLAPLVITIAMREGTAPGGAFGILAGLLWDLSGGAPFGFYGLFLMLVGILSALLVQTVFHPSLFTALLFSFIFVWSLEITSWFFLDYMTGGEDFIYSFSAVIMPTALYSFAFALPFYFLTGHLHARLSE